MHHSKLSIKTAVVTGGSRISRFASPIACSGEGFRVIAIDKDLPVDDPKAGRPDIARARASDISCVYPDDGFQA
jgi:cephalosporin hydroxylase